MAEIKLSKPFKMTTYLLLLTIAVWVVTAVPTLPPNATADSKKSLQDLMNERYGVDVSEMLRGATKYEVSKVRYLDGNKYKSEGQFVVKWNLASPSLTKTTVTLGHDPDSLVIVSEISSTSFWHSMYFKYSTIYMKLKQSQLTIGLSPIVRSSQPTQDGSEYADTEFETFGENVEPLKGLPEAIGTAVSELLERAKAPLDVDESSFPDAQEVSSEKKTIYVWSNKLGICATLGRVAHICTDEGKIVYKRVSGT